MHSLHSAWKLVLKYYSEYDYCNYYCNYYIEGSGFNQEVDVYVDKVNNASYYL